jgi:hypothetical protein
LNFIVALLQQMLIYRECWWDKPLVVALKHSEGIKHTILFQQQEAYKD